MARNHHCHGNVTMPSLCIVDMSRSKRKSAPFLLLPYICICEQHESCRNLQVNWPIFCPLLTKFGFSRQIFINSPIPNFAEIRPTGSRGQADMTKYVDALRDYADAPKIGLSRECACDNFSIIKVCVFVCISILALVIIHGNSIFPVSYYTVVCGLFGCTVIFHIFNGTIFF